MSVLRMFPSPQQQLALKGLYLPLRLHEQAGEGEMLIYANFIASVDGRIALRSREHGGFEVPRAIANPRDWRLYQELAAQSDIMLTSARYFRQLAEGRAQDLLPVGASPEFADLHDWRAAEGLQAQPDVAVLSHSLDIPEAALARLDGRRILIFTDAQAADRQAQALERAGASVLIAGEREVQGSRLKAMLIERGYRSAYMIAGPAVFRTLLRAKAMDRLFLTSRFVLLGGGESCSLLEGGLSSPQPLRLLSLYHDLRDMPGQCFAQYAVAL